MREVSAAFNAQKRPRTFIEHRPYRELDSEPLEFRLGALGNLREQARRVLELPPHSRRYDSEAMV